MVSEFESFLYNESSHLGKKERLLEKLEGLIKFRLSIDDFSFLKAMKENYIIWLHYFLKNKNGASGVNGAVGCFHLYDNSNQPIYLAVRDNLHAVTELLIDLGANPNALDPSFPSVRPLCIAIWRNYTKIAKSLIKGGAQLTYKSNIPGHYSEYDALKSAEGNSELVAFIHEFLQKNKQK